MINLNITKVQIEYLLFIKNYEGRKTIMKILKRIYLYYKNFWMLTIISLEASALKCCQRGLFLIKRHWKKDTRV